MESEWNMSINELRNVIHELVDKSDNIQLLEFISSFFSISESSIKGNSNIVWENFSDRQKELIMNAFEQSNSDDNLIVHQSVMTKIKNELYSTVDKKCLF